MLHRDDDYEPNDAVSSWVHVLLEHREGADPITTALLLDRRTGRYRDLPPDAVVP